MIELILRIITTLILAALESLGSADPAAPPTESAPKEARSPDMADAVPIAAGSEQAAAAFRLLRAVDPCGLHDVAAATRVTGDRPDEIRPEESMSGCQLRLNRRSLEPTWTFTTRVGVAYPATRRNVAAQGELDGHRVYRDETTDPNARACTYTRPIGTDFGISLTARAPIGEPTARPCPIAKAYLVAARSLTRLVLRLEKRTKPRLELATIDPCAATHDVLHRLAAQGTAHPETPYECRIQPGRPNADPHPATPVTISFRIAADPSELVGAGTGHQPVTVASHSGVTMAGLDGQPCELILAHDTNVAIQINHTRQVQTIAIYAASCEQAKTVAEIVVDNIVAR